MAFESRHIGNQKKGSGMMIRILLMGAILVAFVLMMRKMTGFMDNESNSLDSRSNEELRPYWPVSTYPVVQHSTFTLAYDEEHEQAKWVAHVLTRQELNRKFVDRTDWFEKDEVVSSGSADFYDYKGSGFTKGHLVPSADRAWNRKVNAETFLMSNISPQTYHFNAGVWRELEENVRDWARRDERLYIVTGPVIGESEEVIGGNEVAVPEAYFKVLLDLNKPNQKAIGFLIPNEKTDRPLPDFAMSVDVIEELTGIDFYDQLVNSDSLEEELESDFDISMWPVDENRYRIRVEKWNN